MRPNEPTGEQPTDDEQTPDEALAVDTYVVAEQGQWVVYLDVIFWHETVHHRIQAYPSQRLAEIAADLMKRAARRDLKNPPLGLS